MSHPEIAVPITPQAAPVKKRGCLWTLFKGGVLLVVVTLAFGVWWWSRDVPLRFPDYELTIDLSSPSSAPEGVPVLRVGAAKVEITPTIADTWTDADHNGAYEPEKGDSYQDVNGNGRFDPVYIAGYGANRPATGVHDPLWARALVIEAKGLRVGLCALDLVGFFHDDVIAVREALAKSSDQGKPLVDYLLIAATHNHEGPDTLGLWGKSQFESGVDPEYLASVRRNVVAAVTQAAGNLQEAQARVMAVNYGKDVVMYDHRRKPFVVDDTLGVLHFTALSGETIATFVNWSDHPETMEDVQTLITSDFPHWLREGVEQGVGLGGRKPVEGVGGICLFFNGSVGGMMTSMSMDLPDYESGEPLPKKQAHGDDAHWKRPQSVGEHVAAEVLRLIHEKQGLALESPALRVRARTFFMEIANPVFRLGAKLGVLDRGSSDQRMRSEVAVLDFGPVRMAAVPGEIYPELVIGGIETPEGNDFGLKAPVETPPLKERLREPGVEHVWVLGLANDELGYFIPKSEWDMPKEDAPVSYLLGDWESDGNPPYLYGADGPPYGEINSCGPDAAKRVLDELQELLGK